MRRSILSASCSIVLCGALTGCGRPVQVDIPENFHGDLVVHCTSTGVTDTVMHANVNGVADGVCPPMETGVRVFRNGQRLTLPGSPEWERTSDGIPMYIRIDVD